jgi:hypothetical protein
MLIDEQKKISDDYDMQEENKIQAYFLTCQIIFKGGQVMCESIGSTRR